MESVYNAVQRGQGKTMEGDRRKSDLEQTTEGGEKDPRARPGNESSGGTHAKLPRR